MRQRTYVKQSIKPNSEPTLSASTLDVGEKPDIPITPIAVIGAATKGGNEPPLQPGDKYLRAKPAWEIIGLKKSTFYNLQDPGEDQYDETFPPGRHVTKRIVVWRYSVLMAWVEAKPVRRPNEVEIGEDK
jgi:predicted DNA-binding transcriptional regulator AlpA